MWSHFRRAVILGASVVGILIGCAWYLAATGYIQFHLEFTYQNFTEEEEWDNAENYQNHVKLTRF